MEIESQITSYIAWDITTRMVKLNAEGKDEGPF